jgi:hypothetical protein
MPRPGRVVVPNYPQHIVQLALTELWEHREGTQMTHAAYQATGGVAGGASPAYEVRVQRPRAQQ